MEPVSTAAPGLGAYAAAAPQGWGAGRQRGQPFPKGLCLWGSWALWVSTGLSSQFASFSGLLWKVRREESICPPTPIHSLI